MPNIPSLLTPPDKKQLKDPVSCPNCKSENIVLKRNATTFLGAIGAGAGIIGGTAVAIEFFPLLVAVPILGGSIAAISICTVGVVAITGTSTFCTSGAGRSIDKAIINSYKCLDCQHQFKAH